MEVGESVLSSKVIIGPDLLAMAPVDSVYGSDLETSVMSGNDDALLLPSTIRLLKGMQFALDQVDVAGRADLANSVAMLQLTVSHLVQRQRLDPYPAIYSDAVALGESGARRFSIVGTANLSPALVASDFDEAQRQIGLAIGALRRVAEAAAQAGTPAGDPIWGELQAIERRFYAAYLPDSDEATAHAPASVTLDGFDGYMRQRFPGEFGGLSLFQALPGGFQKQTVLVKADFGGSEQSIVVRAEKGDRFLRHTASDIADEYSIVRLMWDAGLPVAEPLWLENDPGRLGTRFMVSRRAAGANAGNAVGSSSAFSPALLRSFLSTLATIHAVPLDAALAATPLGQWLAFTPLAACTRAAVAYWREQMWLASAPASVAFTRIFDWLEANVPQDDGAMTVIHNDYGPHNILVDGDRISAVLDWENARLGDPAEDLSYFIQAAGAGVEAENVVKIYEEMTGLSLSKFRMRYFDVFSCAKVLAATLSATAMYQATDAAILDWVQLPILWHGGFQHQVEQRIAAAEAVRGT